MSNAPEKKGVSAVDFFCIGFGAIVGVGWAVSINGWMASCGGPVPAAVGYLVVLLMMVPIGLCYAELVPMLPVAGGGMAFAFKAFNDKVALISGWASLGGMIAIIPWEAIQITDVLGYLIPGLKKMKLYSVMGSDIYLTVIIIGVVFSLLLFALNMRGLAAAAFVQKILCFVLVGCALIGAIAALIYGFGHEGASNLHSMIDGVKGGLYSASHPGIYSGNEDATRELFSGLYERAKDVGAIASTVTPDEFIQSKVDGLRTVSHHSFLGGMFAIVVQAAYFLAGFETIPQGVEDAGGDIKTVGKTVVLSVTLACIFYAFLLFSFGFGYQWEKFIHEPEMMRPAASSMLRIIYEGTGGNILYWLLTIGAIAGLFTTWNGFFTASANLMMGMGRGKLIPAFFAKQNKNGVAVNGQKACLLLSVIGPFLGANMIDTITCFSALGFVISWGLTAWSLVRLRMTHPDMERPYKIPGGMAMGLWASIVTTVVFILSFIPKSPFFAGKTAIIMFVGWMMIGILFSWLSEHQRTKLSEAELEAGVFGSKGA